MFSRASQVFLNLLGPSKPKLLTISSLFRARILQIYLALNKSVKRNIKNKLIAKYFTRAFTLSFLRDKIPDGTIHRTHLQHEARCLLVPRGQASHQIYSHCIFPCLFPFFLLIVLYTLVNKSKFYTRR